MSTLMDMFQSLCTKHLIPETRQKDIKTALRYLAAAYTSVPERLTLTNEMELMYKHVLREHLVAQGKKAATIRNTVQSIGQFLRAYHALVRTPVVPPAAPATRRRAQIRPTLHHMVATSPYKDRQWLARSHCRLPLPQWPAAIRAGFERWLTIKRDDLRPITKHNLTESMKGYLGFLAMTPETRLDFLPADSLKKLQGRRYVDDSAAIAAAPVLAAWDDLFVVDTVRAYLIWHAWRIQTPADAQVPEKPPSFPSWSGLKVAELMMWIADALQPPSVAQSVRAYRESLGEPRKIHNKRADVHQFTRAEIDQVGQWMMEEARGMNISKRKARKDRAVKYQGAHAASRFQLGLILRMVVRTPLRLRNWCEMLREDNLRQVNGEWRLHFEGRELKVSHKRGELNIFDMPIDPDIVPDLEEFFYHWRPRLPNADTDRHVFLGAHGPHAGRLEEGELSMQLKTHVAAWTGKRIYPHLIRTIFTSELLTDGVDINSVAYGLNDNPQTVWQAYNELISGKHEQILQHVNRRTFGHAQVSTPTPPVLPVTPKVPRRLAIDPAQLSLLEP
jgi:hypothetical protein